MNAPAMILACLLIAASLAPARALDLFGVALETSKRDSLRAAARAAGLTLLREGGDDNWFDVYDSSEALAGSRYCYLGFVRASQDFAFVEYEFDGLDPRIMLGRLRARYGEARVVDGKYLSDQRYTWQRDGIEITLAADWPAYRVRLSYIHPQNMAALRRERAEYRAASDLAAAGKVPLY